MKLTIRDLIRLRHCESHYRLGKLGIICCIKNVPSFFLSKEGLFNFSIIQRAYFIFRSTRKKHFWNTAETGSLITASMKPAGIRTLPGGIALLTGSLSRVIRF